MTAEEANLGLKPRILCRREPKQGNSREIERCHQKNSTDDYKLQVTRWGILWVMLLRQFLVISF
jgi:hypothetical protein